MSKDAYGSRLKKGTNLSVLAGAKKFFQHKYGVTVISYEYTRDCGRRPKRFLKPEDMTRCSVCRTELYTPQTQQASDGEVLYVKHKQYLKFKDVNGKYWPTCYKLNQCYKSVEFDPTWACDGEFEAPDFESFISMKTGTKLPPEVEDEIKDTYEHVVMPFIFKWGPSEITKDNVMVFMRELKSVLMTWAPFFSEDSGTQRTVENNLLSHIGVKNER